MSNTTTPGYKLKAIWNIYGSSIDISYSEMITRNDRLIDEFFFVVLGGYGISYEQNKSALEVLKKKGALEVILYKDKIRLSSTIEFLIRELSLAQFEPRSKTGQLRKYRFMESKGKTLARAGNWLWGECKWDLIAKLHSLNPQKTRDWLCKCPGIGLKSASWYLRNIGFNYDYAVFDVHVLKFLKQVGFDVPHLINNKSYIELEQTLRDTCNNINVSLGAMDYLIWLLGRNNYTKYLR